MKDVFQVTLLGESVYKPWGWGGERNPELLPLTNCCPIREHHCHE